MSDTTANLRPFVSALSMNPSMGVQAREHSLL